MLPHRSYEERDGIGAGLGYRTDVPILCGAQPFGDRKPVDRRSDVFRREDRRSDHREENYPQAHDCDTVKVHWSTGSVCSNRVSEDALEKSSGKIAQLGGHGEVMFEVSIPSPKPKLLGQAGSSRNAKSWAWPAG